MKCTLLTYVCPMGLPIYAHSDGSYLLEAGNLILRLHLPSRYFQSPLILRYHTLRARGKSRISDQCYPMVL